MTWLIMMGLALAGESWCGSEPLHADRGWRPSLSGEEQIALSDDGWFRVHYTIEGEDKPTGSNSDGIPDMVPRVLDAMNQGQQAYLDTGWRALARDDGDGGDDAIDVYITQIDAFGYANAAGSDSGDVQSCFMRLDPDLPSLGEGVVESVAFHELHHCVQYRYTTQSAPWIYEAQATLEQYRLDDNAASDLFVDVLWINRLSEPERAMDRQGSRFEYAGFIFPKYWEETMDSVGNGPGLWSALAAEPAWRKAFETASIQAFERPFAETFLDFAVWNGFACANDDGAHYRETPAGCTANTSVPIVPLTGDTVAVELPQAPYAASYAEVPAGGSADAVAVSCVGLQSGEELMVAVVARDVDGVAGEASYGRGAAELIEPIDPSGDALLVFASVGAYGVSATCTVERVFIEEEQQGSCAACSGGTGAPVWWLIVVAAVLRRRN